MSAEKPAEANQDNKNTNPGFADGGSAPRNYASVRRYGVEGIRYGDGTLSLRQLYIPKYRRTSGHALDLQLPDKPSIKPNS